MFSTLKKHVALAAVLVAAVAASGCGSGKKASAPEGAAKVSAAIQGQNQSHIDRVTLTISGPSISSPIVQDLVKADDTHWAAFVTSIPAGSGYTFAVDAYGAAPGNTHLYSGIATNIAVTANGTVQVSILAQEVNPTAGPVSHVPVIDALTASAVLVTPGSQVDVRVAATSPEAHALTYLWASTCPTSSFDPASAASTRWTAPGTAPATCQLSVTVKDASNQTSVTAYLVIQVANRTAGDAQVNAQFNTYPVVTLVKTDEVVVQPGQAGTVGVTADVVVTAQDPDGDLMTYTYNSTCAAGTFTPPGTVGPAIGVGLKPNETRFFSADPTANCTITVAVADGRGGTTTGTVHLSGAQAPVSAPVITRIVAPNQNGVVTPGTKYTLRVEAKDPQAQGLTFAWTSVSGALSNQVNGAANTADSFSTIDWTAPNPLVTPMSVKVVVTNPGQGSVASLTTEYTFLFASNDPCFGQVDGASCQGPNLCLQDMTCQAGVCQGGAATVCTASDACHLAGVCDPGTGTCNDPIAVDGTVCNDANACSGTTGAPDVCAAGTCVAGGTVVCEAPANTCLAAGTCSPATGCSAPTPVALGTACVDADLCTQTSACDGAGTCVGSNPISCTGGQCSTGGTCNPASGICEGGVNQPVGTACDDADTCTTSDVCNAAGQCAGAALCPAGQTCDPVNGTCQIAIVDPQLAKGLSISALDGLAMDLSGATYVAGPVFQPVKSFDGISVLSAGGGDLLLAKYDVTGSAVWAKPFGDAADQLVSGAAVTADGTVVALGTFDGTIAAGGTAPSITNGETYPIDYLVGVDAANGAGKWAKKFNNGISGVLLTVSANPSLDLLAVCGYTNAAATDLVPGATFGGGPKDVILGVFNSAGTLLWSKQLGAANEEQCDSIAIDDTGNVYAAGKYAFTFNPGLGDLPTTGSGFRKYMWIAKYNGTTGAPLAQSAFGNFPTGAGTHSPASIAFDFDGNVIVAGSFSATLPFGAATAPLVSAGSTDVFVAKLAVSGAAFSPTWAVRMGGAQADECRGVAVNSFGEVVATGLVQGTTTGAAALTAGGSDAFVLQLDGATGATHFARQYGDGATQNGDAVVINRHGAGASLDLVSFAGGYLSGMDFGAAGTVGPSLTNEAFVVFSKFQAP